MFLVGIEEVIGIFIWFRLTEGYSFALEHLLNICIVAVPPPTNAATEHVEGEEEDCPGSAEPAGEQWSRELRRI